MPKSAFDLSGRVALVTGGSKGLGGVDLEQLQGLAAATARAFERFIVARKRGRA